jgi:hypothetical protein
VGAILLRAQVYTDQMKMLTDFKASIAVFCESVLRASPHHFRQPVNSGAAVVW